MRKQMKKREGILRILLRKLVNFSKRKLFWNKIFSMIMMVSGYLSINLLEGDATVCILLWFFGLVLLFSRENLINIELNYEEIERVL